MRLRNHLLISALAGAAIYPRTPRRALLLTIGGVFLDIDHYLLYALRSGDWNPLGALRYNRWRQRRPRPGDTRPRYGSLRSAAHQPELSLPLAWLLAQHWRWLRPLALGLTLHLALDVSLLNLDWRVWWRAAGRCERCGAVGVRRDIHYIVPAEFGGSRKALTNRAAWCSRCTKEVYRAYNIKWVPRTSYQ